MLIEDIDTIRFDRALQLSLNLGVRAEYYVGPITLRASIDLLGVTFGPTETGIISSSNGLFLFEDTSGQQVYKPFLGADVYQTARPYLLNLALPGDLSRGMLTTEAFIRIRLTEGISVKAGYQWLTTEMATKNKDVVSNNNRFRHRTDFLSFGITAPLTPW